MLYLCSLIDLSIEYLVVIGVKLQQEMGCLLDTSREESSYDAHHVYSIVKLSQTSIISWPLYGNR